jgi:predicted GIY-YIG superfamily endonuclease
MHYLYFTRSLKNQKVYVGITEKTPEQRVKDHNFCSSAWSKNNLPLELLYFEKYHCKKDAQERELFYKSGFGRQIKSV